MRLVDAYHALRRLRTSLYRDRVGRDRVRCERARNGQRIMRPSPAQPTFCHARPVSLRCCLEAQWRAGATTEMCIRAESQGSGSVGAAA